MSIKNIIIILAVALFALGAVSLLSFGGDPSGSNTNQGGLNGGTVVTPDDDTSSDNNTDDTPGDTGNDENSTTTSDGIAYTYTKETLENVSESDTSYRINFDAIDTTQYSFVTITVDIVNSELACPDDGCFSQEIGNLQTYTTNILSGKPGGIETVTILICNRGIASGIYFIKDDQIVETADFLYSNIGNIDKLGVTCMQDVHACSVEYYMKNLRIDCYSFDYTGSIDDVHERVLTYNNSSDEIQLPNVDVDDSILG